MWNDEKCQWSVKKANKILCTYVKSLVYDSVMTYEEIIDTVLETRLIKFNDKKETHIMDYYYIMHFFLVTILLLIVTVICYYCIKRRSKKDILPY